MRGQLLLLLWEEEEGVVVWCAHTSMISSVTLMAAVLSKARSAAGCWVVVASGIGFASRKTTFSTRACCAPLSPAVGSYLFTFPLSPRSTLARALAPNGKLRGCSVPYM